MDNKTLRKIGRRKAGSYGRPGSKALKRIASKAVRRERARLVAGMTWDAETDTWIRPEDSGAIVTKAPKGWKDLFGAPENSRGLTVVSLAYDWKESN